MGRHNNLRTGQKYPAGNYPSSVAAADLDKDGDTDIAVTNPYIDKVSVLKRRSDGTFAAPVKYTTGDEPGDIVGREDFAATGTSISQPPTTGAIASRCC